MYVENLWPAFSPWIDFIRWCLDQLEELQHWSFQKFSEVKVALEQYGFE